MNAKIIPIGVLQCSEKHLQKIVTDKARLEGWLVYSIPDSRMATLKGFPDLVLIREPEIIFAELKTEKGRLTPDQSKVLEQLTNSDMETHVWRPSDIQTIFERLSTKDN